MLVAENFKITDSAAQAISKFLLENKSITGSGLRIGVRGGGCSGMSYVIDIGLHQQNDYTFSHLEQKVFIDPKSFLFLNNCELDFIKGLMESGFKIKNPKVKHSCGCGESFDV